MKRKLFAFVGFRDEEMHKRIEGHEMDVVLKGEES